MPEPTVNERIAKRRGWKPPGHPDTRARRKLAGMLDAVWDCHWLHPGGVMLRQLPLFDTDPATAMGLLRECSECEITRFGPVIWGVKLTLMDNRVGDGMCQNTLEAAVAAAFLAAMEAKGG